MFGLSTPRLIGSIVLLLAMGSLIFLAQDRFRQKAVADDARACAAAAASLGDDASLARCLPQIRGEVQEARRARLCEAALLPSLRPETRFAASQACGGGTKRLIANLDAQGAIADNLKTQLAERGAAELRAVARAEARSAANDERDRRARITIDAAPRGADGSIRCDADCLRRLGQ